LVDAEIGARTEGHERVVRLSLREPCLVARVADSEGGPPRSPERGKRVDAIVPDHVERRTETSESRLPRMGADSGRPRRGLDGMLMA
jgi:hypothetical protein